ncbi:MAG TPA: hypothetical protein VIO61_03190 [Anaerolineaceae bacterium]
MLDGDYIWLSREPRVPPNEIPTRIECENYEFMYMSQMCNIAEKHGLTRSQAARAFGGDKGKLKVISERKARAFGNRKYVLVSAVVKYFQEMGIRW